MQEVEEGIRPSAYRRKTSKKIKSKGEEGCDQKVKE